MFSRFPWVTTPVIVAAPMRVMSGAKLAVAVSAAGGLGFIGPAVPTTANIRESLEEAQTLIKQTLTLTPTPKLNKQLDSLREGAVRATSTLPVGVGFQLWADDLVIATDLVRKYKPCVTWLYAPKEDVKDFIIWSSEIRRASPETAVWIQIGTVAEVHHLLEVTENFAFPDAIVVQGAEAGGHGRANDGIGLITLLPEVADLIERCFGVEKNKERRRKPALIAAGGIADGRGVAAALCLGADGIAMGTRFLAASEACISPGYQREIVRASDGGVSTTRTLLYNQLRGTVGWPKHYSPRTIINQSYVDYHQNGVSFKELKRLHDEALSKGDSGWGPEGRFATYAGASVGLIKDVQTADTLVRDIQRDADLVLGKFNTAKGR